MTSVYFIEKQGIKYYKTDSFWSKSKEIKNAKRHGDSEYDQDRFFEALCYNLKPYKSEEWDDENYLKILEYKDSIYGYQTIIDPECSIVDTVYLKVIEDTSKTGEVSSTSYKIKNREDKINKLIN